MLATDSTDTVRSSTESSSKKEARSCAECKASKGLKYQVLFQGRTRFLCSDNCFKAFREKQKLAPSVTEKCRQCKSDVKSPGYMTPSGDGSVCSEKCLKEEMRHQLERLQCNHCHKSEDSVPATAHPGVGGHGVL
ncbi:hypothetical protein LAZ67_5000007 [Cordylochernes scorpioides]|uniref:TRASH domain-containing protein n=1 Tax=Cordylochernes scorpioides TaxID=51811 RepID=A0ABY6KEP7_9ARAC|nr:hypothetical protein LAZ67_5000007 [Cordylochernes scorpioides]